MTRIKIRVQVQNIDSNLNSSPISQKGAKKHSVHIKNQKGMKKKSISMKKSEELFTAFRKCRGTAEKEWSLFRKCWRTTSEKSRWIKQVFRVKIQMSSQIVYKSPPGIVKRFKNFEKKELYIFWCMFIFLAILLFT